MAIRGLEPVTAKYIFFKVSFYTSQVLYNKVMVKKKGNLN